LLSLPARPESARPEPARPEPARPEPARPEPAWQKMAQSPLNDTAQPVDSEEEGRSPTTDRRWRIEKKDEVTL